MYQRTHVEMCPSVQSNYNYDNLIIVICFMYYWWSASSTRMVSANWHDIFVNDLTYCYPRCPPLDMDRRAHFSCSTCASLCVNEWTASVSPPQSLRLGPLTIVGKMDLLAVLRVDPMSSYFLKLIIDDIKQGGLKNILPHFWFHKYLQNMQYEL